MDLSIYVTYLGILVCILHSAMFSGANLAFFSLGRMRLEAEAEKGSKSAAKVLRLRMDSNLLLCTILWGNVSSNVLLSLLSESVFAGLGGFLFSTIGITFFGEIIPQAYFSRHALRVGALLSPVMRFYQILLYPVAKACAFILDGWIGPEGPVFFRERDIEIILEKHINESSSEISANEGQGALNFLDLDDRQISGEGSVISGETFYRLETRLDLPTIPPLDEPDGQAFVDSLKKHPFAWAIITDLDDHPVLVLDTTSFLTSLFVEGPQTDVYQHCHRPIIVTDDNTHLDVVLGDFVVEAEHKDDHVVDNDVVLFWTEDNKRIITGADIFGHLLKGIAKRVPSKV
ncbi:CNNM domain-containing protein [bacterium]|nr:CNNM domain-containing protein [bacterium]MDB4387996.1 CNNM domain-containing protein [Akkermansiaceae bacterium]MDB4467252.1 CNNM domain-containing protein [Akkermansiaceae bacterium]MDB4532332.1 CNNM domain-containing protein [bacterium]MDB4532336.1 CNNM domain-containing protein [bacterium]